MAEVGAQPTAVEGQGQPGAQNPGECDCNVSLNLSYFKTKPARFKLIGLGLGLLAWSFTAASYNQAAYNNPKCYSNYRGPYEGRSLTEACKGPTDLKCQAETQIMSECKDLSPGSSDGCTLRGKIYEKYLDAKKDKAYNQKLTDEENKNGVHLQEPNGCPISWLLVQLPVIIFVLTWTISLITIIVLVFVDLNKKIRLFAKIDFIGHIVAAVLSGISVLFVMGFVLWAFLTNYPCADDDSTNCPNYYVGKGCNSAQNVYGFDFPHYHEQKHYGSCLKRKNATYQIWLLIVGLPFIIATTVVHVCTALLLGPTLLDKLRRIGQGRGAGGGQPTPQQATSTPSNAKSSSSSKRPK